MPVGIGLSGEPGEDIRKEAWLELDERQQESGRDDTLTIAHATTLMRPRELFGALWVALDGALARQVHVENTDAERRIRALARWMIIADRGRGRRAAVLRVAVTGAGHPGGVHRSRPRLRPAAGPRDPAGQTPGTGRSVPGTAHQHVVATLRQQPTVEARAVITTAPGRKHRSITGTDRWSVTLTPASTGGHGSSC